MLRADGPADADEQPESASDADAMSSDAAENVQLADRLLAAQEVVAALKRRDFVEEGMASIIRPKFAASLQDYESLRNEVLGLRRAEPEHGENPNHELQFNGVTSYVELPTLRYAGENPFTIEAIVSPDPIPGFKVNPELSQLRALHGDRYGY
jgi:hypothetical protein